MDNSRNQEKEEKESLLQHMTKEVEQYKDELHNANTELKNQRAKNDVSLISD